MSSVAKKILMGSGAVDDYEIDQSLMFASGDGAYLHRTPGSAGNRKTWTFSAWVKRGHIGTYQYILDCYGAGNNAGYFAIYFSNDDTLYIQGWSNTWIRTAAKYRDPSAWYHIVFALDTTQSTAADRFTLYVNGSEISAWTSDDRSSSSEDDEYAVNNSVIQKLGVYYDTSSNDFDGYMAEVHLIDGTALAASAFGKTDSTTGQWIPKKASVTYGTNGFYLKFVSGALGTDSSGEGNNYTTVNLADADVMLDTPTNNFAVLNPLFPNGTAVAGTYGQGNLRLTGASSRYSNFISSMGIRTGAWYWEYYVGALDGGGAQLPGILQGKGNSAASFYPGSDGNDNFYGISWWNGGNTYGAVPNGGTEGAALATSVGTFSAVDIIGFAADIPNGTLKFYKNGTLTITVTGIGTALDWVPVFCCWDTTEWGVVNFGQTGTFANAGVTAGGNSDANGYGNFKYSVPSGYLALCSKNLSDPTIAKPTDHFNPIIYTGNGSTQSISGVGFQPDLVWIKNRAAADDHKLTDAVREATKEIESNTDAAGATNADGLTSFASDGFALGDDDEYNTNTETYVSWNWKAGGTPTADNSASAGATPTAGSVKIDGANLGSALAGSIAATRLSANTTSGFSIVTYAGGSGTVAHGLGVAPSIVMQKKHDATGDWLTYVDVVDGSADVMRLNTGATITAADPATNSTSTVFSTLVGGNNVVAYCFASIEGYSKMGCFRGNANAFGTLVYTGFRPAMVIIRNVDADATWVILDNKRNAYNVANSRLYPSDADAESTSTNVLDFLSDGFKLRTSDGALNASNADHIYLCFAESPFKYSNAR